MDKTHVRTAAHALWRNALPHANAHPVLWANFVNVSERCLSVITHLHRVRKCWTNSTCFTVHVVTLHADESPLDCWDYMQDGGSHVTGVYNVTITTGVGAGRKQIYCDMDTDGGG